MGGGELLPVNSIATVDSNAGTILFFPLIKVALIAVQPDKDTIEAYSYTSNGTLSFLKSTTLTGSVYADYVTADIVNNILFTHGQLQGDLSGMYSISADGTITELDRYGGPHPEIVYAPVDTDNQLLMQFNRGDNIVAHTYSLLTNEITSSETLNVTTTYGSQSNVGQMWLYNSRKYGYIALDSVIAGMNYNPLSSMTWIGGNGNYSPDSDNLGSLWGDNSINILFVGRNYNGFNYIDALLMKSDGTLELLYVNEVNELVYASNMFGDKLSRILVIATNTHVYSYKYNRSGIVEIISSEDSNYMQSISVQVDATNLVVGSNNPGNVSSWNYNQRLVADFTAVPQEGDVPLSVLYTNLSRGY